MNIFAEFQSRVLEVLKNLQAEGVLPPDANFARIAVEPPREASHGDLATNAAMVLAKPSGLNPRELAERIAEQLEQDADVEKVEIAGAGFINLTLAPDLWREQVGIVLRAGVSYGDSTMGQNERVNIEYVSANPTGPMHVGHARGAVVGDALARLLERVGYDVTREYYVNDSGAQIDVLADSVIWRMGELIESIPEGYYPGDYLKPVAQSDALESIRQKLKEDGNLDKFLLAVGVDEEKQKALEILSADELQTVKNITVEMMLDIIRDDLAALGIKHDVFVSETTLHESGKVEASLEKLDTMGLIYQGILEPPKGNKGKTITADDAQFEEQSEQKQTIFKSTQFGDDSDRVLRKADGSWTYFAPDIAYHLDKYERGFSKLINVWGADHAGYIKRMKAAVTAVTDGKAVLDVKICQMVKLMRDGKPVKMSKRSGDFITLRSVVDEVGKNAVRFMMLTRKNDAPLDFDFTKVMEKSRENPVFYVQYAHARVCSVLRNVLKDGVATAAEISDTALAKIDLTALKHPAELALMRQLGAFPRLVESAAEAHEPHRIAFYLGDLSASFHALWNLGKEFPELKFIQNDKNATLQRLALIRAVALAIASGLDILGVEPEQEMR